MRISRSFVPILFLESERDDQVRAIEECLDRYKTGGGG